MRAFEIKNRPGTRVDFLLSRDCNELTTVWGGTSVLQGHVQTPRSKSHGITLRHVLTIWTGVINGAPWKGFFFFSFFFFFFLLRIFRYNSASEAGSTLATYLLSG